MTLSPAIDLVQGPQESQALMRKHGKTFYFASRLLGAKRGEVVGGYTLYAGLLTTAPTSSSKGNLFRAKKASRKI